VSSSNSRYSIPEIDQAKYAGLTKLFNSFVNDSLNNDRRVLQGWLMSLLVSYCQPELTMKRLGKILHELGVSNLDMLKCMDELKKLKKEFHKKEN
jgi:hypothetical protein